MTSFHLSRRGVLGGLAAGGAMLLAGCDTALQKPYPEKRSFVLAANRPTALPPPSGGPVLVIRRFRVSPGYEGRGLVTRTDALTARSDFYNEFFVAPATMIEEVTARWLGDCGLFEKVAIGSTQLEATHILEGTVTGLYGDFTAAGRARAVVEMQLLVLDVRNTRNQIVAKNDYRIDQPINDTTPDALVSGWNQALGQIMGGFETELRARMR